jgi:uncharacterized protein (DUF2141 family)
MLALCLAPPALAAAPAIAQDAPLTVVVSGLRYASGSVHVDVCTRETFLTSNCPWSAAAPAQVGDTVVTVPHVPPGVYAVQAFHDFRNIGKPTRGAFGVPTEGIAFSNDAPLGLRGPSFARAAFTHAGASQTIRMRLHRFRPAPPAGGG